MTTLPSARMALLLALSFSSCDKGKKNFGIEYEESSMEQTAEATAAAFAESGDDVGIEPEIEAFFTRMGQASRSSNPLSADEFISVNAMLETAEAAGVLEGLDTAEKRGFRKGFHQGIATQLGPAIRQMAYDRHRIARIEKPSENRRIVFANHYDNELNVSTPMRWWLVSTDDGWRIHDFEDLSIGLRTVGLMSTMMKAGLARNPEPWIKDFVPAMQTLQQTDMTDPESIAGLREPMDQLLKHELPTDVRRFASTMLVSAYMADDEIEKAEHELQAAEQGGYASALAHYQLGHLLMGREDYHKALDEFARHVEAMGEDSDILESVSDCHFMLGETDKARASAERGLDDNPAAFNCLASLAAASSIAQLKADRTTARFEASGDPAAAYEIALDYLLDLDETEKARALYQTGRKAFDDQDLLDYYDELLAEPAGD